MGVGGTGVGLGVGVMVGVGVGLGVGVCVGMGVKDGVGGGVSGGKAIGSPLPFGEGSAAKIAIIATIPTMAKAPTDCILWVVT